MYPETLKELTNQARLKKQELAIREEIKLKRKKEEEKGQSRFVEEVKDDVEKTYKQFAQNIGRKVSKKKEEGNYQATFFCIKHKKEDMLHNYKEVAFWNVFPYVRLFPYQGVVIYLPDILMGKEEYRKEGTPLFTELARHERQKTFPEGDYLLDRVRHHLYFIPLKEFSEGKLAAKLTELYEEAVKHWLM